MNYEFYENCEKSQFSSRPREIILVLMKTVNFTKFAIFRKFIFVKFADQKTTAKICKFVIFVAAFNPGHKWTSGSFLVSSVSSAEGLGVTFHSSNSQ